jgi:predicted phage terminase large subunit-like protein
MIVAALDGKPGEVWYVGLTQGNARDTMWRLLHELAGPVIKSSHVNNLQITLINGATISLKGSDRPETMRGSSLKLVVLDEAAFMKPFVWEEILRPALADQKGSAVFISTPDGRSWFYDLYVYADQSDDEDWVAYHLTSYDNELLDSKEIDAAKRSMSTMAFTQEFMASFNARESELFKEDWLIFDEEEPEIGDYYIAIDPAGFEQLGKKGNKRLDDTAIAIVKVNEKGWWVKEIKYGRWTFDETVRHIFHAVQKFRPISVGIERGIAKQAMMSPLMDMMKRHNLFFRIEELTHGNINKANRVINALQGRMEHGRIVFNKGDWNIKLVDQLMQFPSPLTHDDLIDSLSYIDQLAHVAYSGNWEEYDDFEILDAVAGY